MLDTQAATQLITCDPEIMSGTPVFRGTRVPVDTLFDWLESGFTLDEILDDFPSVSREQAVALLRLVDKVEAPEAIARNSAVMGGTPVFPGTRMPIIALADYFEADDSINTFLDHFPTVKHKQVVTLLECLQEWALLQVPVLQKR